MLYRAVCVATQVLDPAHRERDVIVTIDIYDQEGDKVHLNTMF